MSKERVTKEGFITSVQMHRNKSDDGKKIFVISMVCPVKDSPTKQYEHLQVSIKTKEAFKINFNSYNKIQVTGYLGKPIEATEKSPEIQRMDAFIVREVLVDKDNLMFKGKPLSLVKYHDFIGHAYGAVSKVRSLPATEDREAQSFTFTAFKVKDAATGEKIEVWTHTKGTSFPDISNRDVVSLYGYFEELKPNPDKPDEPVRSVFKATNIYKELLADVVLSIAKKKNTQEMEVAETTTDPGSPQHAWPNFSLDINTAPETPVTKNTAEVFEETMYDDEPGF